MLVKPKPLSMVQQLLPGNQRPGLAGQGSNALSRGQIDPFDKCRLDDPPESVGFQHIKQLTEFAPRHALHRILGLAPCFALDQLPMPEIIVNYPMVGTCPLRAKPMPEMGCQGVEIPPNPSVVKLGLHSGSRRSFRSWATASASSCFVPPQMQDGITFVTVSIASHNQRACSLSRTLAYNSSNWTSLSTRSRKSGLCSAAPCVPASGQSWHLVSCAAYHERAIDAFGHEPQHLFHGRTAADVLLERLPTTRQTRA
jgi:hypothetical protein